MFFTGWTKYRNAICFRSACLRTMGPALSSTSLSTTTTSSRMPSGRNCSSRLLNNRSNNSGRRYVAIQTEQRDGLTFGPGRAASAEEGWRWSTTRYSRKYFLARHHHKLIDSNDSPTSDDINPPLIPYL